MITEATGDDVVAIFRPFHGEDNPKGTQAALLASIKLLRARYADAKCDDQAVACCTRCNVMFLVRTIEDAISQAAIATLSPNVSQSAVERDRDLHAARCLRGYAKSWANKHRDIADDFDRGAEALEHRAALATQPASDTGLLEALERELAELKESWFYLHKLVERGLFCKSVSPTEALEAIAFHPTAPWKNGRWDVDHKPYAVQFYAKFPKARNGLEGSK